MTAKLSPDSVSLIFSMHEKGCETSDIAEAVGCAGSTVVRYLNEAGFILGNKGRGKQINADYLNLALDMRGAGSTWHDVEAKIGFHRKTFQRELRAMRASP